MTVTSKEVKFKMVAGHLREQNGIYQMILSYKDKSKKRKTKSISTHLPVKGNKKRAEAIVKAVTNYTDAKLIAKLSEDLGEAMVGINEQEIEILMAERGK